MIRSYITWESLYYLNGYLGKPLKKIGEQLRRHFLVYRICRIRDVRSPFHRYTFRVTYRVKRVVNFRTRSPASRERSERSPAFPILTSTLVSVPGTLTSGRQGGSRQARACSRAYRHAHQRDRTLTERAPVGTLGRNAR